jgi:hypothetical protein
LFRALINTESPEAVDEVVKLLDEGAFRPSFANSPEWLGTLQAAARNAALLRRLPDLRAASPDSPAAGFKTSVLALDDTPAAADELAAVLNRGGELAFQAALALAQRGDARCRTVLVDRLEELLQQSHEGYLILLPLLQPDDFAPIKRAFEREVAQQKELLVALKRRASRETDKEEKNQLTRQIDEFEHRENWWMERWLRLFGATRHPEAKPLLLNYLDDANHQARAGAIDGLGYGYDDEIGERLTARLAAEQVIPDVLVRALGKSGDRRRLPSLLDLAEKPTLIGTKSALIEAIQGMQAIDRLKPKLESWSRSPNATLAAAAKRALNGDRKPAPP